MNIFHWVKQKYLDWWYMNTPGEKAAVSLVAIVIIAATLALMFVNN